MNIDLNPTPPERPGTLWAAPPPGPHASVCRNCGRGYTAHGAPEDIADAFNVPRSQRHLICPASEAAWDEFRRQQQRATIDLFVQHVLRDMARFSQADRRVILGRIASDGARAFADAPVEVS
jgi:hypothetical protein